MTITELETLVNQASDLADKAIAAAESNLVMRDQLNTTDPSYQQLVTHYDRVLSPAMHAAVNAHGQLSRSLMARYDEEAARDA